MMEIKNEIKNGYCFIGVSRKQTLRQYICKRGFKTSNIPLVMRNQS